MASSSLSDGQSPFVVDTSVAINLEASGIGAEIFRALARPIVAVDVVPGELQGGGIRSERVIKAIHGWEQLRLLSVVPLGSKAMETFEDLISGKAAATLDDGEAATLAYAHYIMGVAVIDEAKARRISSERFPAVGLASTIELMLHVNVVAAVGRAAVADAVFESLTRARMRVPAEMLQEVVELIGAERASSCHSLPRLARFAK